jgi:hypothetical protein
MNLRSIARPLALVLSLAVLPACGARKAEVRTAPAPASAPTINVQVNNNLTQAVNVYVTMNGADTFLRQVPASSAVTIPVPPMFTPGSTVGLKAVTVDGVHNYTRGNVVLNGTYVFPLP